MLMSDSGDVLTWRTLVKHPGVVQLGHMVNVGFGFLLFLFVLVCLLCFILRNFHMYVYSGWKKETEEDTKKASHT